MDDPVAIGASPSLLERVRRVRDSAERALARQAPARALLTIPRTASFLVRTARRRLGEPISGLPGPAISPALAAQVAIDEAMLAIAMSPNRFPRRADYERVSAELAELRDQLATAGWLDDPRSYHREPPPTLDPAVTEGWALGLRYERILFPSDYEPHPGEPGSERWRAFRANRTAVATVLRHPGGPRPWVVAIHGFGMGIPVADFVGLGAARLHRELGLNVVMPVLPLHGPRRASWLGGEQFLSFDLVNTVHGLEQSIWDIRRVIRWVRTQDAPAVGVYGVSLGGYTAALLAAIEPDLACVVAGIPVADFPSLMHAHSPVHVRLRSIEHAILGGNAEAVNRVVSPLAMESRVPVERRFIFAGMGDRLARPRQAHALWRHWGEPRIQWYAGNHLGYLWAPVVRSFIAEALASSGIAVSLPEAS